MEPHDNPCYYIYCYIQDIIFQNRVKIFYGITGTSIKIFEQGQREVKCHIK